QMPALLPGERLGAGVDREIVHGDDGTHREPPGQQVLRPMVEVDPLGGDECRQAPVIPADLVIRRRKRDVDRPHVEAGEDLGPVGEDDVLVPALLHQGADELARVRPRATEHAHLRPDPDPDRHERAGAPTGATPRPLAAAAPASAPRASARTMSARPRSAYPAALAPIKRV